MSDTGKHALQIVREFDVPAEKLYKVWMSPDRYGDWFCPKPWKVVEAELDMRAGGSSRIVMQGPEGERFDNVGIYLEIVENRRIVFTDAYVSAWVPSDKPFMTGVIEFEDLGNGRSRYTARALDWSEDDMKTHEQMGFEEGWGVVADQMADVARSI